MVYFLGWTARAPLETKVYHQVLTIVNYVFMIS